MAKFPGISVFIQPAEVLATYNEDRLIDIKWVGMEGTRRGVIVATDCGNSSMPKPGDRGLVIGTGNYFYFIGKIEYDYKSKVEGKYVNKDTGKKETARQVDDGEAYFTNTKTKSWLSLSNSGDMSILNGVMEGFKYLANLRFSQLVGKTAGLFGNGIKFVVGTTVRNVPGAGDQPVVGTNGGKALEALLQIAYMGVQSVRLHLGDVTDLTTGLIPELSAWNARLKAVLEVTAGSAPLAAVKMDVAGNTEIASTLGSIKLNSTLGSVEVANTGIITIQSPLGRLKIGVAGDVSLEAGTSLLLGNPLGAEPAILGATFTALIATLLTAIAAGTAVSNPADCIVYCQAIGTTATTLGVTLATLAHLSTQVTIGRLPGPPIP
jgi:hypothetical protein